MIVPARGGSIGIEKIPARYCLLEISSLLPSHQPLKNFSATPGYPPEAQERDYRLQAERGKVEKIAQDYEPSLIFNSAPGALDGLPVVNEKKFVLGGNGRAMATMLVRGNLAGGARRVCTGVRSLSCPILPSLNISARGCLAVAGVLDAQTTRARLGAPSTAQAAALAKAPLASGVRRAIFPEEFLQSLRPSFLEVRL